MLPQTHPADSENRQMKLARILILVAFTLLILTFFAFGLDHYLTLEYLKSARVALRSYQQQHLLMVGIVFSLTYLASVALSIPSAAALTLLSGALFGLFWGTVIASFSSTIGATLAFLAARFVFRDVVERRYGDKLQKINDAIAREGGFYLFTLRLVPVFPFFLVNLVMGLTPIRTWTYYWITQLGALAGTLVYVNAGTELGQLRSLDGILSPSLIGSFVLLGFFPYGARGLLSAIKRRRIYRAFKKPRRYDRNLVVIGAGAAGLTSAYVAATTRAKVTLVEKGPMGGDCLNYGCVPSKALIHAAKTAASIRSGRLLGVHAASVHVEFSEVMKRIQDVIMKVAPHDSIQRYQQMGVDVVTGDARVVDPWTVEIKRTHGDVYRLTTRNIVVATGAEPYVPEIPGLMEAGYLTSSTVWGLRERPRHLVVLGGGPMGSELSQAFARLDCQVTQIENRSRLLPNEDPEVSRLVAESLCADGVQLFCRTKVLSIERNNARRMMVCEQNGASFCVEFDQLIVATGRVSRIKGYGLEELGIIADRRLAVNDTLQTNFPNIYGCGDVASKVQLTNIASHMAWYATVNALFGKILWLRGGRFRIGYEATPKAVFTDPEVARIGLSESEAVEKSVPYEIARYELPDLDRAIIEGMRYGFIKVLTKPGKDRMLGVTIVGKGAADLIGEYSLAIRSRLGLKRMLGVVRVYPTLSEVNKYVAGAYMQGHRPTRLLRWAEKYHAWQRHES